MAAVEDLQCDGLQQHKRQQDHQQAAPEERVRQNALDDASGGKYPTHAQFPGFTTYPRPRTVCRKRGSRGSASILRRRRVTCTSIARSPASSMPSAPAMSSRDSTSLGLRASVASNADSPPVRRTTPSRPRSSPRSTSKLSSPSWIGPNDGSGGGAGARRNSARIRSKIGRAHV